MGGALYALVLLGVAYAVGTGLWGLGAFDAGELDAALVRHGQWWRALTALTLHLDAAHLGANLAAGVWFGYLAGRLLGPGSAWALIVTGAGAANLLEGLIAPAGHRSAGASTAVFTALGLLAVRSWLDGYAQRQRWALRVSPLVAGIVLLAWLGSAGEHTDVFAHLSGFVVGGLLGALSARGTMRHLLERIPQWLAGAWALGLVGLAWLCALR
jgi:membrane associated rhomboid family serine protease